MGVKGGAVAPRERSDRSLYPREHVLKLSRAMGKRGPAIGDSGLKHPAQSEG